MAWQPLVSWQITKKKSAILSAIRHFFMQRGVIEVETPLLSNHTITDVHLDAFACKYDFSQKGEKQMYLQTSPEFAMKRLLAAGHGDIYQICKAFRHEPSGRFHNAEFTILEWYRLGFDHWQLMDEVEALLMDTLKCSKATRVAYQDAFIKHTNIDPLNTFIDELKDFLIVKGKFSDWLHDVTDIDTLLQFIFCEFVEPLIGITEPCFIYGFPVKQASLARVNCNDKRIADRFECYFRGVELANGFYELDDHIIQLHRFEEDNAKRELLGLSKRNIDHHFISALEHGLPECSGVALGIDRLVMLATHSKNISKVLSFDITNA